MLFADRCSGEFPNRIKSRGREYFLEGRVILGSPHARTVRALVEGSAGEDPSYQTTIWLEDDNGKLLKILFVSDYLSYGGFVHPMICPTWAKQADWENAPGFYMVLTDQPGDQSWPITGASFILLYKEQPDLAKARAMLKYFDWCYSHGADDAKELHYVPIPEPVVNLVEDTWKEHIRAGGKSVWQ